MYYQISVTLCLVLPFTCVWLLDDRLAVLPLDVIKKRMQIQGFGGSFGRVVSAHPCVFPVLPVVSVVCVCACVWLLEV